MKPNITKFLGKNPYNIKEPVSVLSLNLDVDKSLVVKEILSKIITESGDLRFAKGRNNLPTLYGKYIGICGQDPDSQTGSVSLVSSENNSLFTIQPTTKYRDSVECLQKIVTGQTSFHIIKSENNTHSSEGTYLTLSKYYSNCQTPSCIMLEKDEYLRKKAYNSLSADKDYNPDNAEFMMEISNADGYADLNDLIYQVFCGNKEIKIKKAPNNFPSARGTYLGFCDSKSSPTPCNNPVLALSDDADKSSFIVYFLDLFNIACCLKKTTDHVACGSFFGNSKKCDSIVKNYCKILSSEGKKTNLDCSCIFSSIVKPGCFDQKCSQYGYKPEEIKDDAVDCSINDSICYELHKEKNNNDLDPLKYQESCGNYSETSYWHYIFDRYWVPILVVFFLSLAVLNLYRFDSSKTTKK